MNSALGIRQLRIVCAIAVLLLVAMVSGLPLAPKKSIVLRLWNSRQPRRDAGVICTRCDPLDLARGLSPGRPYAILVFDGAALPPSTVLGMTLQEITAIVVVVQPRIIFASLCHGGEVAFLEALFRAAPSLDVVLATPDAIPWQPRVVDGDCIGRGSDPLSCITSEAPFVAYRREDMAAIRRDADALLNGLRLGRIIPSFTGIWPHYTCVPRSTGAPVALVINDSDIPERAPAPEDIRVSLVPCLRSSGVHSVPAEATP